MIEHCEIALRRIPWDLIDVKSALVQLMALCHQEVTQCPKGKVNPLEKYDFPIFFIDDIKNISAQNPFGC